MIRVWTKKLGQKHYALDGMSRTLCGMPMLGNNYADIIPEHEQMECEQCAEKYEIMKEDETNMEKMEEGIEEGVKVRVRVPVQFEVDYIIKVKNPDDVDMIQETLIDTDASRWETDPQFYERLGDGWDDFVRNVKKEHIEVVEG